MSETVSKRLFIGGLSKGVSEDEVTERFSRFGKVSNLSMKSRQDEEGNCTKVFAHLDIEGSEDNVKKCFSTYQGTKWKGSVLRLQYAKENFLTRLEKEREADMNKIEETSAIREQKASGEWKAPEFTTLNGPAVPGTPVPGKKDWIVGKYGRVLPVLNVKKSYKVRAIKHDPSKFCHAAKVFKDENAEDASNCDSLTWEITQPDSEITKKRKGEFPPSAANKKPKKLAIMKAINSYVGDKLTSPFQSNTIGNRPTSDFEVVKIGQTQNSTAKHSAPSRFDSDYEEEDTEYDDTVSSNVKQNSPKTPVQAKDSKLHNSQNKSDKTIERTFKETSGGKLIASSDTKASTSKSPRSSQVPCRQNTIPAHVSDSTRKIPEFAGLRMLVDFTPRPSEKLQSRGDKSSIQTSSTDKLSEQKEHSNMLVQSKDTLSCEKADTSEKESLSSKRSAKKAKESVHQASSVEPHSTQNSRDRKKFKGKKNTEKIKLQDSISPIAKSESKAISKVKTFVDSHSSATELDGCESASSADTDEIISRCKSKNKSNNVPTSDRRSSSLSKSSLLNQSIDLSEFSASAPEILSDSPGSPSHVVASVDSDSYDSDLDSNDFELVAKKLAKKTGNSEPSSSVKRTPNKKLSLEPSLEVSLEKSAKKASLTPEKKGKLISVVGKSVDVKLKDSSSTEKSFLQRKLLKIATSNIESSDKKANPDQLSRKKQNKHVADNEKRLQALDEQMKLKERQKQIVRTALENVDSTSTKRIVFSSSDEDDDEDNGNKKSIPALEKSPVKAEEPGSKKDSKTSSPKLTLLGSSSSDESDYEDMFKSKPQFEGKKGEKLMAMQRKMGDSRFQLDEKFMESEDSDNEEEEAAKKSLDQDGSFADEKKMNLEILDNVVGKSKMDQFTAKLKRKTKHIIDMNAVRFDPTKMNVQNQEPEDDSSEEEEEEEMEIEQSSPPLDTKATLPGEKTKGEKTKKKEVPSKSTVTMASSLVDMLKSQANEEADMTADDTSFSLLQQFDQDVDDKESSEEEDVADMTPLKPKETIGSMKMDTVESSDEGSEEEDSTESESESSDPDKALLKPKETIGSMKTDMVESSDEDSEEEDSTESESESSDPETDILRKSPSKEEVMSKIAHVNVTNEDADSGSQEDNNEEQDEIHRITTSHDPQEEKEKTLLNAGKTDIRFTKDNWLQNWDEIRTDLMKMCRKKHKDAGKRKRLMNEKKRKTDILKNVKRKPWIKG